MASNREQDEIRVGGQEVRTVEPAPPRFMYRVMNIPVLRKAPWLMYVFMFCVAVGIAIMCVRLQLGDDLLAIVCASVTFGLIVSTAICVFFSIRRDNAQRLANPPKKKRVTVTLRAQDFDVECGELTCSICLLDLEKGDRVTELDCGHLFHVDCASNWVRRVAQCPACRFKLPTEIVTAPNSGVPSPNNSHPV